MKVTKVFPVLSTAVLHNSVQSNAEPSWYKVLVISRPFLQMQVDKLIVIYQPSKATPTDYNLCGQNPRLNKHNNAFQ